MDLTPYLDALRRDLAAGAAPAGEQAARVAELLANSLEPAARLSLLEALSDAAAEITTKLRDVTVEIRLRGREAELVVIKNDEPTTSPPAAPPPPAVDGGGEVARVTLRLPETLKEQVEAAAANEGTSVNAWLVRAVSTALYGGTPQPSAPRHTVRRITGFAQA